MSLFKRKPEPPQEIAAEERLDEVTREVASQEFEREGERERTGWRYLGPLVLALPRFPKKAFRQVPGDRVHEPVDDPDPGDEEGLRDALHEHESKQ